MASYTTNYRGMEKTNAACNGITKCKWKPRKVSAKRDFPKAFDEVIMNAKLSVSNNEPQNLSDNSYGASQLATKRKVSLINELPTGVVGDYGDDVRPVEFEDASTEAAMFDLSYESTEVVKDHLKDDSVPFEMDSVSCGSSSDDYMKDDLIPSEMASVSCGSSSDDYMKDDLIPSEMASVSGGNSIYREMFSSDYDMRPHTTIEHEDTDVDDLVNTDKATHYIKRRRVSAIRCFPPGCGTNTGSENAFSKWHATSDDDEEEIYGVEKTSNDKVVPPGCGTNTGSENDFSKRFATSDDDEEEIYGVEKRSNVKVVPPGCGTNIGSENVFSKRFATSDDDEEEIYGVEKTSNVKVVPPGCGTNTGSGNDFSKRFATSDDDEEEIYGVEKTRNVKVVAPGWGTNTGPLSEEKLENAFTEWTDVSDDEEEIYTKEQSSNVKEGLAEADVLAPYTELKIHGGSVKKIRFYQNQGQMEIKLSVSNSQKYSIDVKASGEGCGINEHAAKRTTTTRKQLPVKRSVSAVRCYPPGCGPDAAYLPEKELKGTLTESQRHMLICKWCNSL